MHPTIGEFCRVSGLDACRPEFFRRVQRELRDQVQPLLDDRDRLIERVRELEAQVERLTTKPKAAVRSAEVVS